MPRVSLPPGIPGIRSLFVAFPETADPLLHLAQTLLRNSSPLTTAERELLAAWVSIGNHCEYCAHTHGEAARILLGVEGGWVDDVYQGRIPPGASAKLKALLAVAEGVRKNELDDSTVASARSAGVDDRTLHDTVLIASAFCLYNRYVDGLATLRPPQTEYPAIGRRLADKGYQA